MALTSLLQLVDFCNKLVNMTACNKSVAFLAVNGVESMLGPALPTFLLVIHQTCFRDFLSSGVSRQAMISGFVIFARLVNF